MLATTWDNQFIHSKVLTDQTIIEAHKQLSGPFWLVKEITETSVVLWALSDREGKPTQDDKKKLPKSVEEVEEVS